MGKISVKNLDLYYGDFKALKNGCESSQKTCRNGISKAKSISNEYL